MNRGDVYQVRLLQWRRLTVRYASVSTYKESIEKSSSQLACWTKAS